MATRFEIAHEKELRAEVSSARAEARECRTEARECRERSERVSAFDLKSEPRVNVFRR
jgi:hypothetical protein